MKANTTTATTTASIIPGQIEMDIDTLDTLGTAALKPAAFQLATNDALTFREYAPDMDDRNVLGYILSLTTTRDRDGLIERLLDYFGSLKAVLEARPEQLRLVKGVGEKTANLISSYLPIVKVWQRRANDRMTRIGNTHDALNYCKSILAGSRNEHFWCICLSAQCEVLGKRKISEGSLSEVNAYPRSIVETALNYNAHSILLTHNHPGGTMAPSREDIASTLLAQKIVNSLGIMLLDHIIVAGDNAYSMIQHGDIDYRNQKI